MSPANVHATFTSRIAALDLANGHALSLPFCQQALSALERQLNERVKGRDQKRMNRRIVQAVVLNGHALVEGMPGAGKTSSVDHFSGLTGYRSRRIQCQPDLLPGDLIGIRRLDFRNGQGELTV